MVLFLGHTRAQVDNNKRLEGSWLGTLSVNSINLRVIFKFKLSGDTVKVTLDSPDQGAKNIPLKGGWMKGDSVFIDAPALRGFYNGVMLPGDSLVNGKWTQGGASMSLTLHHLKTEFKMNRPQEPKGPFPYVSEDLTFLNAKANIELAGTLTLPQGKGPFPAVVMVTGSGRQNRDEELMGHKPFLLIADYLTRHGIAVLRYDDRGSFRSQGNFAESTTFDFADDAEAAFNYLRQRKEINPKEIGIIGHSEGGLIAPIVASRNPQVAFIVMLAGPGVPGSDIILEQIRLIDQAAGMSKEKIDNALKAEEKLFRILKQQPDQERAAEMMTGVLDKNIEEDKDATPEEKVQAKSSIPMEIKQINTVWFRTFIDTDPRDYLSKVKCPVLALNGAKDLQVPPDLDLAEIEKALKKAGNKHSEVKKMPDLNHLFQHCTTGSPMEYGQIEETFSPEALGIIADWILKTVK